ncbi:MAG: SGNH/GDSL hydrolase family protein [Oscillospiraceae bacterium]|nr:SGNH/GDSL hydrolase family protein [Oscillospiraceae bacterium]
MKNSRNSGNTNSKTMLLTGIIVSFIVFAGALTIFYINRDEIYNFLRKSAGENQNSEITGKSDNPISGGVVPLSNDIPDPYEYFSNIIFIGDSITSGLDIYRDSIKFDGESVLKDASITATKGYGVHNAVSDVASNAVNLIYGGKAMKPEDVIAEKDEKYVFIDLGLNDLGMMTVDKYMQIYGTLIDNIQAKNPDKTVVILSVTPLVAGQQSGDINNDVIIKANDMLLEFAKEHNIPFID